MTRIQQDDIDQFVKSFEFASDLTSSSFLITGATGLIGSTLVRSLKALNRDIRITCPVRNMDKVYQIYGKDVDDINFIECDLLEYLLKLDVNDSFQYIVHCASPTAGRYMSEHPVETYELAYDTTRVLLKHAQRTATGGVVYVSSLEYYGQNLNDSIITEDYQGYLDNTESRSSYPLGKRAAEFLCVAYAKEFGVNVKIARLTQTFGAGIAKDDNRVFAQFARSVVDGTDIVLHTTGESAKPYCYTTDCVSAILYILLRGNKGEAYNVANKDTYISIKGLAEFLRDNFNPSLNILVEEHPELGYAPTTRLRLCTEKIESLGWLPRISLFDMFHKLINSMKYEYK